MSSHYRNLSPGRGRQHIVDPMRASTGMVELNSAYDPYDAPRRYDYEDYPSDTGYASAYGYRSGRSSNLEAHPVASRRFRDPSSSAKKRTEYTVQPRTRHRSNTTTGADHYKTPVHLTVPSTSRQHLSPVHHPRHHRDPSPLPAESGHHLVPASSRHPAHRRIQSTDYASDTGHRDSRHYPRHWAGHSPNSHRAHPPPRSARYPAYDELMKGDDIDHYDAYSYTNAREQFDRDYPVKPRPRGPRYSLDRPSSITGMEDPQWTRRDRHHGPPPTSWGLDKLGRERPRASTHGHDDHRDPHRSNDGFQDQALVVMPQDSEGEYTPRRDEHRRRRAHRSHHEGDRGRHNPDDRHLRLHAGGALAGVGLGTAALGGGYSDMSEYEHYRPSRGKHRHSHEQDERSHDAVQPPSRELVAATQAPERSKDYLDPADAHRHRRSRRHTHRRTHSDVETSDDDLRKYRREPARQIHSSTDSESDRDRDHSRDRSRHHRRDRDRDYAHGHRSSRSHRMLEDGHAIDPRRPPPNDAAKDDAKRLVAVDPPMSSPKEPEAPPKGILKAPREAFPEEPNPVREGVAPLKDATKEGIPPGARWTKIDRRLVNPEALEAGNERFEERPDYVIVLRVLSKEEIQQYALKTQEIRDTRHKEHLRERRKSRDEIQRQDGNTSSDDEDESDDEPPRQLEAPPAPDAPKLSLPSRPRASSNSMHEAERPRVMHPSAAQV
ncbi:uncharacterized protein N7515_000666 [Penicillium bovifimosum]|uniref:DUF8035 domain-containing protein n=1 Tax=Penicillium bovifimosum TaxID=126998 RepID=A0A9W9HIM5_9EURO|nr:uncharacterized protein N7515_000666 [Penicillium bovifimosum]KAJ5146102.1 hypothetical protein N7515_000666 [Penicillium bovifimosum]